MMIKQSSLDYQLWESFVLVRKANDGEAPAQHELGLRYLQGKGFQADTLKAVSWLKKAADQDFDLAHFNLGILSLNGWGIPWNPFAAFRNFQNAARRGMPEADFVLGLMYTEDLIVGQDWQKAYSLVKKAADTGFEPAKKALVEFQRRGIQQAVPASDSASDNQLRPIFIDFDVDTSSTNDDALLNDLLKEAGPELKKAIGVQNILTVKDTSAYELIRQAGIAGSPEALALLGRFSEQGIVVRKNAIQASASYLVALRNDSHRAFDLLWNLVQEPGFPETLESRAKQNDAIAQFVWAGLVAVGIDRRLSGEQALKLLQSSAVQNYTEAMVELGLCYQSGRWVEQDRARALELWEAAGRWGNVEALVRLKTAELFMENPRISRESVAQLQTYAGQGSLLAQVALGFCHEHGLGVPENAGEASRAYRDAAQRGSQTAYEALKRMHDKIRPEGNEWVVG
jgi:TPR repeat protein